MLFKLPTKKFSSNRETLYEAIQKESKYGLENQDEYSHHGHEVVLIQVLFNVEHSTLIMWVNLDWKIANLNISWDVLGWDVDL
jgi:hypothetical protein